MSIASHRWWAGRTGQAGPGRTGQGRTRGGRIERVDRAAVEDRDRGATESLGRQSAICEVGHVAISINCDEFGAIDVASITRSASAKPM